MRSSELFFLQRNQLSCCWLQAEENALPGNAPLKDVLYGVKMGVLGEAGGCQITLFGWGESNEVDCHVVAVISHHRNCVRRAIFDRASKFQCEFWGRSRTHSPCQRATTTYCQSPIGMVSIGGRLDKMRASLSIYLTTIAGLCAKGYPHSLLEAEREPGLRQHTLEW